ncbi:MAG TPA: hypothetical protein VN914_09875, partial [Polyangia bacterium]|nr:hypothetical protein [Polyangia bacterium]
MAERLLAGEVLNRQVQDVHPGYLSLLHAGAFAAFGVDLLSLRYPLIAASLVQAGLVFRLFGARLGAGLVASLGVTVLGLLGFLDPTANWYCLLLLVALATALGARRGRTRLLVVGLLLGLLALFRQLSGAFALAGVLACLLVEEAGEDRRGIWLGRALIATAALGLALYLARAADPWGWLFFGIWPVLALGWIAGTARVPDRRVLEMLGPLALGALAASLPLFLYHLATGSLGAWLQDVTSGAFALSRLEFRRRWLYGPLALDSLGALLSGQVAPTLDAIHWLVLLLAAAGNGVF